MNNNASNLEWVTSSENRAHWIKYGNVTFPQTREVLCVENGIVFEQAYKAASWLKREYPDRSKGKISVAACNIRAACRGDKHTAYEGSRRFNDYPGRE